MQQVGFVVFPNFQVLSFAAITEMANVVLEKAAYAVTLLSERAGWRGRRAFASRPSRLP